MGSMGRIGEKAKEEGREKGEREILKEEDKWEMEVGFGGQMGWITMGRKKDEDRKG